jgi:ubiquinone/menaquinone biosynthesis C-methylase UbiE
VLPFAAAGFDVVVVNSVGGLLASLADNTQAGLFRECYRVLRQGGRLITIEAGARTGLSALWRPGGKPDVGNPNAGDVSPMLGAAGFKPVRLLADREGLRFTEGLKG